MTVRLIIFENTELIICTALSINFTIIRDESHIINGKHEHGVTNWDGWWGMVGTRGCDKLTSKEIVSSLRAESNFMGLDQE